MTVEEARRGLPVEIAGVVTYERGNKGFFLQDPAGDGLFVLPAPGADTPATGRRVEVRGETAASPIIPYVRNAVVLKQADDGGQPSARRVFFDELMTGRKDAQFVELPTVIRTVEFEPHRVKCIAGSGGGRLLVEVPRRDDEVVPAGLTDAAVRLRGVIENTYNERQQLRGLRILLADLSQMEVVQPGISATNLTVLPVSHLLRFAPETATSHRVRLRGVVTYCRPGSRVVIQDDTGGVLAETLDPIPLQPGDAVEALGYVAVGDAVPYLRDTTFERIQSDRRIVPLPIAADEVLTTNHNSELLQVGARLINQVVRSGEDVLFLQGGNTMFTAHLDKDHPGRWPNGSLVRVTGVCVVLTGVDGEPRTFRLLLRDMGDVKVVKAPSFWTGGRVLVVTGLLAALVALTLVWIGALRRRVARQADLIRRRLKQEAALEQRYRDLFQHASDPVFTLDREGRITSLNRAGEKLMGCSEKEARQIPLSAWVVNGGKDCYQEWLGHCRDTGPLPKLELHIQSRAGRLVTLEVKARRIDADGQPVALHCVARDITDWNVAQVELTRAKSELERAHEELSFTHDELERLHCSLEGEIAERQRAEAELERIHSQLVITSHEAGVAEVATGVLHNTGNVLNSINVSTGTITDLLRASKTEQLAKVAVLLEEHADDLEHYINHDDEGRRILPYLEQLASHLAGKRETMLREFISMRKNIEHITRVIDMQRGHAQASGVFETIALPELIEDAVRVNEQLLANRSVTLVRTFDELPPAETDRHKLMQILVNLLSNAAHACAASGERDRRVHIRLAKGNDARFTIEVADNGVGIAPENLTRIFSQGFTTRADGHGFGLHSSALAAASLGGTLKVFSDGPGAGAVFTLELPLRVRDEKETAHA